MFSLLPHIPWSIRSDLCKIAGHHPWFLKDPYEESDPTYTPIPRETRLKWLSMMSHCKVRYDIRPILTSNTAEGIFLAARPLRDRGGGWEAYSFIAYLRRMIWPLTIDHWRHVYRDWCWCTIPCTYSYVSTIVNHCPTNIRAWREGCTNQYPSNGLRCLIPPLCSCR